MPILPRSWHRAIQTHRGSPATASITSIRWAITEPEWYATGPAGISIEVSSSRNHGERQFPSASTDSQRDGFGEASAFMSSRPTRSAGIRPSKPSPATARICATASG